MDKQKTYQLTKELQEDCYQYLILLIDFTNSFEEKKLFILNKEAIAKYKKQRILLIQQREEILIKTELLEINLKSTVIYLKKLKQFLNVTIIHPSKFMVRPQSPFELLDLNIEKEEERIKIIHGIPFLSKPIENHWIALHQNYAQMLYKMNTLK